MSGLTQTDPPGGDLQIDPTAPNAIWQGTVIVFQNQRFIVEKVNPKNFRIQDEHGSTFNLGRTSSAKRAANQAWEGKRVDDYSRMVERFELLTLKAGAVVEFIQAAHRRKYPSTYVITNVGPKNYKLHELGGEGTNMVITTSPNLVRVVPGAWTRED